MNIPKTSAAETKLEQDTLVDIAFVDGNLIVSPVRQTEILLDALLAGVTETNRHHEWQTDAATGREVW